MFSARHFDKHVNLMTRMADTLGIDLETEMMTGKLSPESYQARVVACSGCDKAETCEAFLDAAGGHADAAPDYCRNKAVFDPRD